MILKPRPKVSAKVFDDALKNAKLSDMQQELIEYIRYIGVFSQPSLVKDLRLNPKPPVLSILCEACREIGSQIPNHFTAIRLWSKEISEHGVRWDGNLICSTALNFENEPLAPEAGTAPFEFFVVHKELFTGLG